VTNGSHQSDTSYTDRVCILLTFLVFGFSGRHLHTLPVREVFTAAVRAHHTVAPRVVLGVGADLERLDAAADLFLRLGVRRAQTLVDYHELVVVHVLVHRHVIQDPREVLDHLVGRVEPLGAQRDGLVFDLQDFGGLGGEGFGCRVRGEGLKFWVQGLGLRM